MSDTAPRMQPGYLAYGYGIEQPTDESPVVAHAIAYALSNDTFANRTEALLFFRQQALYMVSKIDAELVDLGFWGHLVPVHDND